MLYRSNTDRVLWPVICIATRSGTPHRTRFRTAVLRKSWGMRPGHPAATQALFQAFVKALIGFGCFSPPRPFATSLKNTHAQSDRPAGVGAAPRPESPERAAVPQSLETGALRRFSSALAPGVRFRRRSRPDATLASTLQTARASRVNHSPPVAASWCFCMSTATSAADFLMPRSG
jgi:hypothetical protein